jgi:hypothetical protein
VYSKYKNLYRIILRLQASKAGEHGLPVAFASVGTCWRRWLAGMVKFALLTYVVAKLLILMPVMLLLQIKREISTMKLIRHPNVIKMHEV